MIWVYLGPRSYKARFLLQFKITPKLSDQDVGVSSTQLYWDYFMKPCKHDIQKKHELYFLCLAGF